MAGWTSIIRGEPGTEVELEVSYGCSGAQEVTLERDVIHLRY
jgi:C-terminal processing protease CtpA/Prc